MKPTHTSAQGYDLLITPSEDRSTRLELQLIQLRESLARTRAHLAAWKLAQDAKRGGGQ